MKNIGIVDTNAGNITSLMGAVERLNRKALFLSSGDDLKTSSVDQLLIPGQGRFGSVMDSLSSNGWVDILQHWKSDNRPILGICVGFQILFESSEEDPGNNGLSWLPGTVRRLHSPKQPMVGWAEINTNSCSPFQSGTGYFVNSFVISESAASIATAEYGQEFVAGVKTGNVIGLQFHPEKSSTYGMEVLNQCLV